MDHKLKAFLQVAEYGNFSRAAEALHMSQPAVSQQIQSLEEELGAKLFERTTKRVFLTRAGKIVEHYGADIQTAYETMTRRLEDLKNIVAGSLLIGSSYTFGEYVLPYVVAKFCEKFPRVRPSIHISNTVSVAEMVHEETVDVGIVEGDVDLSRVESTELMQDKMVVIASPNHSVYEKGTSLLTPQTTWILREEGSGTRAAANRVLKKLGVKAQSVMEFSSTQVIKTSVQAGLGLSILSELVIQSELAHGTLVVASPASVSRPFYLLKQESAFESRVTHEFREFLLEYVQTFHAGN